ncbi:MAG: cell division protein FtsA [Candidatus Omnitrophota bacterium]|nr:cell division protein FtsA [Candidatus Omnitrophota bacterium]
MLNNNYICALDIGSSKIAACVAEINRRRISNIFLESILSRGMRCGAVVDSIELVNAISKLIKNIKSRYGINIKSLYANISGRDMLTKYSRAIIPLTEKGNKIITSSDMQKAIEQARLLGSTLDEEIIHSIPAHFAIDSKSNLSNPVGLYSHKLEVDLYLICAKFSTVQSLGRAINQSGFEAKDFFFSGLATSSAVFDKEFNQGLSIFCDIGSDITELLIFRDGLLRDIEILCKGGDDLTSGLQEELKVPFELAEDIKRSSGIIGEAGHIPEDKEILVKKSNLYKPIKQSQVTQIITDRAKALCAQIKNSLEKRVSFYEINNFIIAGRTIMMEGFIEALENALGLPVKLARVTNPDIAPLFNGNDCLSGHKYLTYLTTLGIVCEALREGAVRTLPVYQPTKNLLLRALHRFKEAYQEYF